MITDASKHGLGAVLCQEDDKRKLQPIAYISRKLRGPEVRYTTREMEGLAIYWAIGQFDMFLKGTKFIVKTDHKSLLALPKWRGYATMLDKWFANLESNYSFRLISVKGKDNVVADCLSRDGGDDIAAAPAMTFKKSDYKKKKAQKKEQGGEDQEQRMDEKEKEKKYEKKKAQEIEEEKKKETTAPKTQKEEHEERKTVLKNDTEEKGKGKELGK